MMTTSFLNCDEMNLWEPHRDPDPDGADDADVARRSDPWRQQYRVSQGLWWSISAGWAYAPPG
jgi:hypothetical protein